VRKSGGTKNIKRRKKNSEDFSGKQRKIKIYWKNLPRSKKRQNCQNLCNNKKEKFRKKEEEKIRKIRSGSMEVYK